jgi:molecular chaperone Hsp33
VDDYIARIIAGDGKIRGLSCVTTRLVEEACRRHGTAPTASAALGRALTGGALLGALLKTGQRVAFKLDGGGPLRKIVVEAESSGIVRGYVGDPAVDLPLKQGKLDVGGAVGRTGILTVTKDLRLKELYTGTVQLYTGEIAEDLAFYLTQSEQIPSAVGLGVFLSPEGNVSASGGILIQSLPPSDEAVVDRLARQIERMPPISELLREGKSAEQIMELVFGDIPFDVIERRALAFRCTCSRERVERAFILIGHSELASLMDKEENVVVTCEFCRQVYDFTRRDLEQILEEMNKL